MVDLFGRSGRLQDARILIDSMPMEPNSRVWGALLNGCKVYGDRARIYSKAGHWVDFSKVRAVMKDQGVVKTAGCSFIEHDHKIHRFVVSDQAHPDIERIYATLNELMNKIEKVGYVANTEFVLHDVEEGVKGDLVKMHSEKLAIAFGLLVYSDNAPMIITKNLRICGDFHNMAKLYRVLKST
ncbi:putative tetratricopeptide-like helical domain superfamily, DYW domain-containing protein [Helianthus anomalus]